MLEQEERNEETHYVNYIVCFRHPWGQIFILDLEGVKGGGRRVIKDDLRL